MRQTFPVAFTLASCQAIAAVAIAVTCIILKSNEDASLGPQLPSDLPRLTCVWLNLLYPLALADLALAQFLMVASIEAIRASSKKIRMAVLADDSVNPQTTLQRLIALCAAASLACGFGLVLPPAEVKNLASRGDVLALGALLWPTSLSAMLTFFLTVLIGGLHVNKREVR